jgi:hypothetical protein
MKPMAERGFEYELDRMFANPPAFADGDRFAGLVEARLDRGWTFRRLLIGGLGLAGGLIGGAQILGSGLLTRVSALSAQSGEMVTTRLGDLAAAHVLPGGLAVNGEVLWMSAALGVVAIGFAVTRVIREI